MIDYEIIQNIQNKNNSFDLYNSTQDLIKIAADIKKRFETFDDDPLILGNKILIDVPHQFSSAFQSVVAPLIQISMENEGKSQQSIAIIFGRYYDHDAVGFGEANHVVIKPILNRNFEIVLSRNNEPVLQILVPFSQVVAKSIELLNNEYQKVMDRKLFV